MKKRTFLKCVLALTALCIFLPMAVIAIWSITGRWPWPNLLPESWTLRTLEELFFGSAKLPELLFSSIFLAAAVAALATVISILTARATEFYDFPGKSFIRFSGMLPLLVPGTVFAMGIQLVMLKLGLADKIAGVVLVHLVCALPYCIAIMGDVTRAVGIRLEEQAQVLGATPLRAFFAVTLPALLPGILSSMSMGFILSYSQYFTTLMVGGGRVKTIALVLVPYIQSGDRALASAYSVAFVGSAMIVFFIFETLIKKLQKEGTA